MSTDPFVATPPEALPRNEPTLAPGVTLPAAADWRSDRPGDLADGIQPRGALFGSPGPNVGYALRLVHRVRDDLRIAPGEHSEDAEAVVAAVAMRRAASFGRAPVPADVARAAEVLGYRGAADPAAVSRRVAAVAGAGHDYGVRRAVADAVPIEDLRRT